jgi:hypothetical protein
LFIFQLGLQTLPMLLSSELFPSEVRAFCKGITRSFACIMLVLSLKFFPLMEEKLTFYGTFYLFAAILFMSLPGKYSIYSGKQACILSLIYAVFGVNGQKDFFSMHF